MDMKFGTWNVRSLYRTGSLKRVARRHSRRWEDNTRIRIYLREMWWEGVDCVHLTQDRDQWQAPVNMVMNLRVP
jgi:hypothetical protein